jgi:capsular exopolysaccharide synthesis family protein
MSDQTRIDLSTFFSILRQRWTAIVACGLVAALLALAFSLVQQDSYKASADLLFQADNLETRVFGTTDTETQLAPERVAATNLELASLQLVAENVRRKLNLDLSVRQLQDRVSVQPKGQADIVTITAKGPTRANAVLIANTFAEEVVAFRRKAAQDKIQRAIDALELSRDEQTGRVRRNTESRLEQLRAIKAIEQGDVTVVQPAVPPRDRAAPKPLRNTVVGALLGLILGVFVALLVHRLDPRVVDEQELARIVGGPVLSRVPDAGRQRRQDGIEALQFLRANVQLQNPRREPRVIVITSPQPGDGKTTVVAGLAAALALSGEKVVAVDCDLDDPTLHEHLGVERGPGLTEALVELRSVEDLLVDARPGLRVLTAGEQTLDPFLTVPALTRLPEALTQLRELADYVILDTPPVSVAADASTVASMADGVIVVVDGTRARRDVLAGAHDQLAHARAHVLGMVINRAPASTFPLEYGGYKAPPEKKVEVA